jgi:hypothetical protein
MDDWGGCSELSRVDWEGSPDISVTMQHRICGDHKDVVDSCVVSLLQELQHRVLDSQPHVSDWCEGAVGCSNLEFKVRCPVSSTGTKIMQSGVWQVYTLIPIGACCTIAGLHPPKMGTF